MIYYLQGMQIEEEQLEVDVLSRSPVTADVSAFPQRHKSPAGVSMDQVQAEASSFSIQINSRNTRIFSLY